MAQFFDLDDFDPKKPRSRRYIQRPKASLSTTRPARFPDYLSLDIILELVQYLDAPSLVALWHTSPSFTGAIDLSPSGRTWRQAVANTNGLPPPIPSMNHKDYAIMLFSPTCTRCQKRQARAQVFYKTHFCKSCVERYEKWNDLTPYAALGAMKDAERTATIASSSWYESWWDARSKTECAARLARRRQNAAARFTFIQQKLRDLGLEDKLARIPDWVFKNHRLVNRSNRLTTRGWARISAEMIRFVEWKAHKYPEVEVTMEVLRPTARGPSTYFARRRAAN